MHDDIKHTFFKKRIILNNKQKCMNVCPPHWVPVFIFRNLVNDLKTKAWKLLSKLLSISKNCQTLVPRTIPVTWTKEQRLHFVFNCSNKTIWFLLSLSSWTYSSYAIASAVPSERLCSAFPPAIPVLLLSRFTKAQLFCDTFMKALPRFKIRFKIPYATKENFLKH